MPHFAEIIGGCVANVIVADQDHIDTHCTGVWIQTSYNTRGNVHFGQDGTPDGGEPVAKNYAGLGDIYVDGAGFHAPQPYPSWTLNAETFLWEPPVAFPDPDGKRYNWDESSGSWVEI